MSEFLIEFGLFAAKAAVLIVLIFGVMALFASAIASKNRNKPKETLEIENLNDKFDETKESLEEEILDPFQLKKYRKEKKLAEKLEKKKQKQRAKNKEQEEEKSRLFVVRFDGDMHASEVENLRECITAIISVATPEDEVCVILNSPGGLVHHYGLAASQLTRLREKSIPLTVAVDLVAASGGYMMACVANKIIAAPFAVVGSIGVLAELPNFHRFLDKHHVDIEHHTAGEYKSTLTMLAKNTDKMRHKFKEELEETHRLFKRFVKDYRENLDIDAIATGEHWYGTDALEKNLIDKIQTSDDYLLEKKEACDIYEISFTVSETLPEKIRAAFESTAKSIVQTMLKLRLFKKPLVHL